MIIDRFWAGPRRGAVALIDGDAVKRMTLQAGQRYAKANVQLLITDRLDLFALRFDAGSQLHGAGIQRQLTRQVQHVTGLDGMRICADCLGCVFSHSML